MVRIILSHFKSTIVEDLQSFAFHDDKIVEVVGKPTGIHKAVELIASYLRIFLVDDSVIPLFEVQVRKFLSFVFHIKSCIGKVAK